MITIVITLYVPDLLLIIVLIICCQWHFSWNWYN